MTNLCQAALSGEGRVLEERFHNAQEVSTGGINLEQKSICFGTVIYLKVERKCQRRISWEKFKTKNFASSIQSPTHFLKRNSINIRLIPLFHHSLIYIAYQEWVYLHLYRHAI